MWWEPLSVTAGRWVWGDAGGEAAGRPVELTLGL